MDPATIAKSLNWNQKHALRTALCQGEETRLTEGKTRITPRMCEIDGGYRAMIRAATRNSLYKRKLLEGPSYTPHLTALGIKVANEIIADWFEDEEVEIEEAPGVTFKPTTLTEYVQGYMKREQAELDERKAELDKVCHAFRGITINEFGGGRRALSTVIREHFKEGSRINGIRFNIWELEQIGEGIEKLRGAK